MFLFNIIRRHGGGALLLTAVLALTAGTGIAHADPGPITPPPPPVIGALQYGPPGYPAAVGIPLLPAGRAGVSVSADTLSPAAPAPANASRGISGVQTSADALSPNP
ncbi:hypothetical protein [Mycobacteroides salmoniphilum]|uniref:Uncharacterized protein n=1 Tax=Mycobacteroides salmoniphilum TaxID=404941 RepID=A0A4R8SXG0_9MYCO|nr:hypothetical protein [Mycobacteroides salmoniphilum]TDZ89802.1 hypothetical protein CCUG62472_04740 [Mycobacteroides salmoniphilum]TEA07976.1 hypothetical protein CCUG60884_00454 [Mycobacteroides salmoniphilum]